MGRIFGEKGLCKMVRETCTKTSGKVMVPVDIEKGSNSRLRSAIHLLIFKGSTSGK